MSDWKEIKAESIEKTPFELIGKDWMLITAQKKDGSINTMTASWGGLGVLWNKNVAFVVIRPQRYTKEFVDEAETLSLSFFDEEYKKQLGYLGKVSGRDEDKIKNSGLTVANNETAPYFAEAKTVLLCKKLFVQEMQKDAFLDEAIINNWYPGEDYHILYVAEIEKVLEK
ncbi:MAG: flavin reductase [Clostridia bacterium]|nr:flavin reductase [Clostridia bacterium]